MKIQDSLGDRQKSYEICFRQFLPRKLPWILRLDGVNWHALTKRCARPFDQNLVNALNQTAIHLCKWIGGAKIAYCQSDEITILIYQPSFATVPWFNGNVNKIISKSAAKASSYFSLISDKVFDKYQEVEFDARVFALPLDEVCNNFEWRQQDATRNSISMVARAFFSHKECNYKTGAEKQEMLFKLKNINWNNLPTWQKRGRCIKNVREHNKLKIKGVEKEFTRNKWIVDNEIPIFHKDRNYIDQYLISQETSDVSSAMDSA